MLSLNNIEQDFYTACETGKLDKVKQLVNIVDLRNRKFGSECLKISLERDHIEIAKFLLDLEISKGIDPSFDDNIILANLADGGRIESLKLLLDLPLNRGVDPRVEDSFPIETARENIEDGAPDEEKFIEVVRLLEERAETLNKLGNDLTLVKDQPVLEPGVCLVDSDSD